MTIIGEVVTKLHSNLDLGVVLVSRELTPKSREILNQGFHVTFVLMNLYFKKLNQFKGELNVQLDAIFVAHSIRYFAVNFQSDISKIISVEK